MNHVAFIAGELNIAASQVSNTVELLDGGATIPFISRYRKERTGSLDEVQVEAIALLSEKLKELDKRREAILESIDSQGFLTADLRKKIETTHSIQLLEDIYLPYKPKRRTKASVAREKGLEPLATRIFAQTSGSLKSWAGSFLGDAVASVAEALEGAQDIIAEWISEDATARATVRRAFERDGVLTSKVVKGKEEEAVKYKDYFDFTERISKIASHRLLAIRRAETEGFLRVTIRPEGAPVEQRLESQFMKTNTEAATVVQNAVQDSYKRLLLPSIENEFAKLTRDKADLAAIQVFAENLRQLLLSAPLGKKRILAIDPGYRTGCKLVCLDEKGDLLHNEAVYPHPPQNDRKAAAAKIGSLVEMYKIDAIAIGNGTASRETEQFVKNLYYKFPIKIFVVSEAGASIYSASAVAREEFPNYDVTVRGAVSIGRRLMDPLAELVKIDPKAIGVGQYQHDVDQKSLKASLDTVVVSCVNKVGVDLNTASHHLLTYVSGLGPQLAKNIVSYRAENGTFTSRRDLLKVPRMGAKAFEQSAGFLRVRGDNPLDNTAVHPEAYKVVERMAKDLGVSTQVLIADADTRKKIELKNYIDKDLGLPTLTDILAELEKPGRDPRSEVKVLDFDESIRTIGDLREGMVLPGIVTNVTNFGAFVDIGIKENGLVHISELKEGYVANPADILKLHQHVRVRVASVDVPRKRIQLSMKNT